MQEYTTKRPTVPAMELLIGEVIPIHQHGFIRLIDYMGNDAAIVQAARVSYGNGTKSSREDAGLINYLMRQHHTTPFEMCELKLHVKLPIFIARQWIRHRMASVNEYSARYSILDREFYIPEDEYLSKQSTTNKQGRSETLTAPEAAYVRSLLIDDAMQVYAHYTELTQEDDVNLARELARMNLTLNYYTQWYWKIDLHNLLHFLHLRSDSHAQREIQDYANAILSMVEHWVPLTHAAFMKYRKNAVTYSEPEVRALCLLTQIKGIDAILKPHFAEYGDYSERELQEFCQKLEIVL
jgi:thymidylate synthase (FAD)